MGFKDGTRNIKSEDTAAMATHVWVGDETDQSWMRGGSYLVARRIRMNIEAWDRDFLADQEQVIGRHKITGGPLTGGDEFSTPDFSKREGADLLIADDAHIRLASPDTNNGVRILRRGYSFTDGVDPRTGQLDAGLFFIAFQKHPLKQFAVLQRRLGASDALNEYIEHTSSAVFACPPGLTDAHAWWGETLF
jgi:deferrochelatase/peroxidase EfeB